MVVDRQLPAQVPFRVRLNHLISCALSPFIMDVLTSGNRLQRRCDVEGFELELVLPLLNIGGRRFDKGFLVVDACVPIGLIGPELSPFDVLHALTKTTIALQQLGSEPLVVMQVRRLDKLEALLKLLSRELLQDLLSLQDFFLPVKLVLLFF